MVALVDGCGELHRRGESDRDADMIYSFVPLLGSWWYGVPWYGCFQTPDEKNDSGEIGAMCIVMPSYSSIYTLSDGIEGWHLLLKWRAISEALSEALMLLRSTLLVQACRGWPAHGIGYYVRVRVVPRYAQFLRVNRDIDMYRR